MSRNQLFMDLRVTRNLCKDMYGWHYPPSPDINWCVGRTLQKTF
jgi:hypothetical protein